MKANGNERNNWRIARIVMQWMALIILFITVLLANRGEVSNDQVSAIIRISPLAMFANLLSSKIFLGGSALSLIILFSSLFVGRAWCGWLCPIGTILDLFRFSKKNKKWSPPENLRKIKYGLLIIILIAAIFGNLTLLIFDPLTIFVRTNTLSIIPFLNKIVFVLEKTFIQVPTFRDAIIKFDAWLRPGILPVESYSYQYGLVFAIFFVFIILLNFITHRFWCRYLCPLGAMLGLGSKLSLIQRKVNAQCISCAKCEKDCPTGTINPQRSYQSDPSECTLCMDCLSSCNVSAIQFPVKWQPAEFQAYDPDRRFTLVSIGIGVTGLLLSGVHWLKSSTRKYLLRPPGVTDNEEFLSKCIRCGVCMQVCPTTALQADVSLSDVESISTPILVPRTGYCDYSCNACGQHCPVEAIPPLDLNRKRTQKIGLAVIDHSKCLAWSEQTNCIVCEEMCPLPNKAIHLETEMIQREDGSAYELLLPVVDPDVCIGCGICENKCPLDGEAAIRVNTLQPYRIW